VAEAEQYQQYQVLKRENGVLWELGRGSMGVTYKALDTNLHCHVALKVIAGNALSGDVARQRFLREARAAAALRHPNVAAVFNLGQDGENYFYVMEFIEGQNLESYVKSKGPLQPPEALRIAQQVARALQAAERCNLIHRDLKPANLMLVFDEESTVPTVKLIDFGLAKRGVVEGNEDESLTVAGGFVGTPLYSSPEQIAGGEIDIRADFYSLGVTLYFMLTGRVPFQGSFAQVMSQHLYKPVPLEPLASIAEPVRRLVQCLLEKNPEDRPTDAADLLRRIETVLVTLGVAFSRETNSAGSKVSNNLAPTQAPATDDSSETTELTPRPAKRRRLDWRFIGAAVIAIGLAMLAGGIFAWWTKPHRETKTTEVAKTTEVTAVTEVPATQSAAELPANVEKSPSATSSSDLDLAVRDIYRHDYYSALTNLNHYLQSHPDSGEAYNYRSVALRHLNDIAGAFADSDKALQLDPKNPKCYLARALIHQQLKDPTKAIQYFDQAIKLAPSESNYYFLRGRAYAEINNMDKAVADYKQAIDIDGRNLGAWQGLIENYRQNKEYEEALSTANDCISANSDSPAGYYERGLIYLDQKRFKKALTELDHAVSLRPDFREAYAARARVHQALGETEKASADFKKAEDLVRATPVPRERPAPSPTGAGK
jgi:serine/threonine protein kinase